MGKGDIKSKRGKIVRGTFGVKRKRPKRNKKVFEVRDIPKKVEEVKAPVEDKKTTASKSASTTKKTTATKKSTTKKATTKKAAAKKAE